MTTVVDDTTGVNRIQDGVIVQADLASPFYLPSNTQTWQDVRITPGRVVGTPYTNLTGQPITVRVMAQSTAASAPRLTVDGVVFQGETQTTIGNSAVIMLLIPIGSTYVFTMSAGTVTITSWMEFR